MVKDIQAGRGRRLSKLDIDMKRIQSMRNQGTVLLLLLEMNGTKELSVNEDLPVHNLYYLHKFTVAT